MDEQSQFVLVAIIKLQKIHNKSVKTAVNPSLLHIYDCPTTPTRVSNLKRRNCPISLTRVSI